MKKMATGSMVMNAGLHCANQTRLAHERHASRFRVSRDQMRSKNRAPLRDRGDITERESHVVLLETQAAGLRHVSMNSVSAEMQNGERHSRKEEGAETDSRTEGTRWTTEHEACREDKQIHDVYQHLEALSVADQLHRSRRRVARNHSTNCARSRRHDKASPDDQRNGGSRSFRDL